MRTTLYIAGAVIEFFGIVLVASPDLVPYAQRFSSWLGRQYAHIVAFIRRLLRRPRTVTAHVSAGGVVLASGHATVEKSIPDDATLEEKVRLLLTRDKEAQRDVQALDRRLDDLRKAIDPMLDALRETMTAHVETSLDRAHREYLALRLVGVALVVVGLTLATTGNFVE